MNIGIDYWQVSSHHPGYFRPLAQRALSNGDRVFIVSAVGKDRAGTVRSKVVDLSIPFTQCIEVIFDKPEQSPELKLAVCKKLDITVFYDDRDDVCRLLTKEGILAMRVTRKDNSTYDLGSDQADKGGGR